jgi:hypothetical protein
MKYGYARVSTDGQSVDAQVRQLTKAGCKKVFREVASGAKTERAQLRRLLDQLDASDVLTVDAARPTGAIHPRPVEHARGDHREESRFPIPRRHMGGHHDITRPVDVDRAWRASRVRARFDPCAHRRRPGAGRGARAENGPTVQTHRSPKARADQAPKARRDACRHRPQLQH